MPIRCIYLPRHIVDLANGRIFALMCLQGCYSAPLCSRSRPGTVTCTMQLGWPDMRLPILYTMSWPERVPCSEATWPRLDFVKMGDLTFRNPDRAKYPAMDLAFAAGRAGGTMTGVLSAANEQVQHSPVQPVMPG